MIEKSQISAITRSIGRFVKNYIESSFADVSKRIDDLDRRISGIASAPKGEKGDPGESIKGDPGKDADPEFVRSLVESEVERRISKIPTAKDGKDASAEQIEAAARAAVEAIPKPKDGADGKDGESVHPDTVYRIVSEKVSELAATLKNGIDGEPGRDALELDILPTIDESKTYPRGTYAEYRGGVIRAYRNTDPITDTLEKAGWAVSMNGIAEESEETADEGRTIKRVTTYTSGRQLVREIKTSIVIDRGVWRDGEHEKGDHVSWDGSGWIAQNKTTDKPGTSKDWRLSTKRGRDGKDGKDAGDTQPRGPVRIR